MFDNNVIKHKFSDFLRQMNNNTKKNNIIRPLQFKNKVILRARMLLVVGMLMLFWQKNKGMK